MVKLRNKLVCRKQGFGFSGIFLWYKYRADINIKTAVYTAIQNGHICGKTPDSSAVMMMFPYFQAFLNLLGSRAFTKAYKCVNFV